MILASGYTAGKWWSRGFNLRICLSDTLNLVSFAVRRGKWSDLLPTGLKVPGHVASLDRDEMVEAAQASYHAPCGVLMPFSPCRV